MDQKTLHEFKTLLENERNDLRGRLSAIAKKDPDNPNNWNARYPKFEETESGNREDEADEFEEYEVRLEAEHNLEKRLLEVEAALKRIDKGAYGACASCEREISLERLRANPAAECDLAHENNN